VKLYNLLCVVDRFWFERANVFRYIFTGDESCRRQDRCLNESILMLLVVMKAADDKTGAW